MAKVDVKTGPKFTTVQVDGLPFLPGLCMHKTPNTGKSSAVFNITHTKSGLAVLSHVNEKELELVRMILGRKFWDTSAMTIYTDEKYKSVMMEALAVLPDNHKRSKKQEERIAKDIKGKRQPASGSRWGSKRDIINKDWLIEAKSTKHSRKSISLRDLDFLTKQAYSQGRIPAYIVELGDKQEIVLLPEQELTEESIEEIEETKQLDCTGKKSIAVTAGLVSWLGDYNCAKINVHGLNYAIISYYLFLEISKRGL